MGAEQSTPRSGGQPVAAATRKTCYYEVLGLDRHVPDDEIRKAYKKKALEFHPDRNFGDVENATRKFAEVQTAYEVLSDPQERAWYDSHRDAVLNGDSNLSGNGSSEQSDSTHTSATKIFSMMGRFNSSVSMDDSPRGFFGILNAFFDQLAMEETAAAEWDGLVPTEYPPFGRAKDDYNSVARLFYSTWSSFATKKSFSWKDKYNTSAEHDRQTRRLMEKANKKFREEGIREFNDAVLSLVAFVKKRDPRYVPNTQSEAERQQALRKSAATQAARDRAAHQEKLAQYTVPEWAQSRDDDNQLGDEFSASDDESSEIEHIECVVCNKTFKSEKQFEAHEKSKKHTKAVYQLKRQMKKDNIDFDLKEDTQVSPALPVNHNEPKQKQHKSEDEDLRQDHGKDDSREPAVSLADQKPSTSQTDNGQDEPSPDSTEEDDEYAPRAAVHDRILSGTTQNQTNEEGIMVDSVATSISNLTVDDDSNNGGGNNSGGKKIGKAKLKREKKAAARYTVDPNEHNTVSRFFIWFDLCAFDVSTISNYLELQHCVGCNAVFSSRSKLFAHLNEFPKHAAPVPNAKARRRGKR
ncbi:hypothetical protein B0T17DRAFT_500270 [Bombardia bombarda]|uniref:Uncharacterized protein n=1 Tax=Bombardia bombarda TaxID=252184 RepID=A0AA39U1F0_9PEZI|nr:hypothetical protein B0T17DRAFT_500270 [Bombardia bombarda]